MIWKLCKIGQRNSKGKCTDCRGQLKYRKGKCRSSQKSKKETCEKKGKKYIKKKCLTECKPWQRRNGSTGRCYNLKTKKALEELAKSKKTKSSSKKYKVGKK